MVSLPPDGASKGPASKALSLDKEDPLDLLSPVKSPILSDQQILSYNQTPFRSPTQGESPLKRRRVTPSLADWTSDLATVTRSDQAENRLAVSLSSSLSPSALPSPISRNPKDSTSTNSSSICLETTNKLPDSAIGDLDLSPVPTSDQEEEQENILVKSTWRSAYWRDAANRRSDAVQNKTHQAEGSEQLATTNSKLSPSKNQSLPLNQQIDAPSSLNLLSTSLSPSGHPLSSVPEPERSEQEASGPISSKILSLSSLTSPGLTLSSAPVTSPGLPLTSNLFLPDVASVPINGSLSIPRHSPTMRKPTSLPPSQSMFPKHMLAASEPDKLSARPRLSENTNSAIPLIPTNNHTMPHEDLELSSSRATTTDPLWPPSIIAEPTEFTLTKDPPTEHPPPIPLIITHTPMPSRIPNPESMASDLNEEINGLSSFDNVTDRLLLSKSSPSSNAPHTTDLDPLNPNSSLHLIPSPASVMISAPADPSPPAEPSSNRPLQAMTDEEVAAILANTLNEPPGKRNLRQRTSLQLQPYTRERLAYKQRLAMRGFKDALLRKDDETEQLRKDKLARRSKDKDANGEDPLGGWLEEDGDELLDMLEVGEETWTPGAKNAGKEKETTVETEDTEREQENEERIGVDGSETVKGKEKAVFIDETRKSKRTYTRRKVRQKTIAPQPPPSDRVTPGRNPNLRAVHASKILSNAEESQKFDFTAFGIDASHAQGGSLASPSLTAPRRSVRSTNIQSRQATIESDADSNLTSNSDSDPHSDQNKTQSSSSSSSSSSSQEDATMILERKKQKILNRMMPAVLAKKHLQDLAKGKAERKALKRAARHVVKVPEGPLRAGQSVVRRTFGASKRPFVIEGDSDSSAEEEQAPIVIEQGRHRQLDVLLNRDVVDPAMVDAIYGTSSDLLPETDEEESNCDEGEDRVGYLSDEAVVFASNDIRRWIGMPSERAESVVDQQLSRTAIRSRNGTSGAPALGAQRRLSRSDHPNVKRADPPRAALNKVKTKKKTLRPAARRKTRPAQIFLDDDSIFGDFQPPPRPLGPTEEPLLPRKNRRVGTRAVSTAHVRGPPQLQRPNPPMVIRTLSPKSKGRGNDSSAYPSTPHRVFARHSSASSVSSEYPSVDRGDTQSSPGAASPGPRILWDTYAGFSMDFGITRLPAGLNFPSISYTHQGHLSELLDLCQNFYLPQEGQSSISIPVPPLCSAFDLELTADMSLSLFSEVFGLIINRLYEAVDPDSQSANYGDVDAQTKVQFTCERAMRFTCLFVTYRRLDHEFVDTFFPAIMDGMESLLERMEPISTPTSLKHIRNELFFRLHWFLLELATRFALSSSIVLEQIRDSQQGLCSILVRRLLEYDFSRTIKSVKAASLSPQADTNGSRADVEDITIEIWVSLIHLCPFMDLDLPQGPSFWIAVKAGLQGTGIMTSGLLAAEKIWYIIQGVCCISQFNRRGITEDTPSVVPYWPLVSEAILSVKLEADPTYEIEVSSSTLKKRDKYVWTVLGRCYLLGARWGWSLNAKDPILGQLGQKVFKTRKFLNLFSDPIVSDFPLFIRESNRSFISEVDSSVDSAFHVFIKIIALAVRDTQKSISQGELTTKQAEREISRLLAISAPMGKVSFTRSCPPSMRELSTLINRYSFSIVSVLLDPAETTAIHSLRQMRNYLTFEVADFKSRKICIRAMMYMAVLHRHLNLSLQSVAEWLGDLADVLLQELSIIDRPLGNVRSDSPSAPKHELIFCLSLILGSIRHIISSPINNQNETDHSQTPYPDPVLLHKSWTEGILASPLALEPMTGLEVLRCVQAFLDARRSALSSLHSAPQNPAGESQDEFGAEFADIDMNDPNLLLLLDGPSVNVTNKPSEANVAFGERSMDRMFASAVNQTVSPAIYKLLSNMVVDDQAWVQLVGERGSEVSREEDSRARDSYVAQLVDCWSGCASVLVQHGMKDWSSYVELGTESWKRFSETSTKRQIGLRFMWNLAQMDPSSYGPLKEHFFSVWFQSIVAPSASFTVEPHYTSLLLQMDQIDDPIFFQLPVERNEYGVFDFDSKKLQVQRLGMLNEVFGNLYVELSRNAFGNTSLLQRKTYLMSCIRDMLLSMADHATKMQGTAAGNNYNIFCWDVIARLKNKAGLVINERTMRELTFFQTLSVVS